MTRRPWIYRGITIEPDGSQWDATHTGQPLRARTKQAIRQQIDDHLDAEERAESERLHLQARRNEQAFRDEVAAVEVEVRLLRQRRRIGPRPRGRGVL